MIDSLSPVPPYSNPTLLKRWQQRRYLWLENFFPRDWLQRQQYAVRRSFWVSLLLLLGPLLCRPEALAWMTRLPATLSQYLPHVRLNQLGAADLLRVPLQLCFLLLFRSPRSASSVTANKHRFRFWGPRSLWAASKQLLTRLWYLPPRRTRLAVERAASHPLWQIAPIRYLAYLLALILAFFCITTPFSGPAQGLFVLFLWLLALWVRQIPGTVGTLVLVLMSAIVSSRYLWWRVSSTLNWDDSLDLLLGVGLLLAELYAWLVLILGYFQTAWPMGRKPAPLPADPSHWPSVDVYIPTYNEPLSVVKPTVFAAMALDWPADKLRIYLLDDGRRDEFRDFAASAGVDYQIRPDNSYAKAGNLNHALKQTDGEFVAIFDCDHIPTRSFLQLTLGWFTRDEKMALMQTPHHFFSPDPFERNLEHFRETPNENQLFYSLVQDGNDLWDATFFCGSCAVLRRAPLVEVGGVAVETVTEDAHTALKLHRLGYRSAYLNIPQAAGLATENLSAHVGQRIRWARGMAQIFRIDNPLFGRGLRWSQRLCYTNAMLHFFYGIPRIIFLTAPLAFLLFESYIIYAPAAAIALYVLPHMFHASLTNSRMQGRYRHSFWAEMYETVLAWYVLLPTTAALFNPGKGKFNVTVKGGLIDRDYFDWTISKPYLVLIGLNLLGLGAGIWRMFWGPVDEMGTVFINQIWTLYNLLILGGAIAVAAEVKQVRKSHRVSIDLPATLAFSNGKMLHCRVTDYSEGGFGVTLPFPTETFSGMPISVLMKSGLREYAFPAIAGRANGQHLGLYFETLTQEQERQLVLCTFARANAWIRWQEDFKQAAPLESLRGVLQIGLRGYQRLGRQVLPSMRPLTRITIQLIRGFLSLLPRPPKHKVPV